jgi:hypothetical protein
MGYGRRKSKLGVARPTKKLKSEDDIAPEVIDLLGIPDYRESTAQEWEIEIMESDTFESSRREVGEEDTGRRPSTTTMMPLCTLTRRLLLK